MNENDLIHIKHIDKLTLTYEDAVMLVKRFKGYMSGKKTVKGCMKTMDTLVALLEEKVDLIEEKYEIFIDRE